MKKLLCPSVMCMDFSNFDLEVKKLNEADIDIFHCDIMDGNFVPNMALGLNDIRMVKEKTNKLIDCHLMIENPYQKIDWFIDADIIYIHPESERYVIKTLNYIKEKGKKPGLAISPDTSIETIYEMLEYVDYLLIMSVNPGFAGQKFIASMNNKIERLIKLKEKYHYKVIIDGACSKEIIEEYSDKGADGFVLGTSVLFNKEKEYKEIIKELRE